MTGTRARLRLRAAPSRVAATMRQVCDRGLLRASPLFFFVACSFTYYGQLNRVQTGDVVGTIYTALALVQKHTIWLDAYFHDIQAHMGAHPYMLTVGHGGHVVSATPSASSLLAVPVVGLLVLAGKGPADFGTWMEASLLTAALTAAATTAVLFTALTRLTTRRRAALVAGTFAWGTIQWGINGQALWEHGGAALALSVALLALIDRRLVLAGIAVSAMVAFRPSTPVIVLFLLPLVGRRLVDWARFLAGILPFALALAVYNTLAFGSPLHQGYGTQHVFDALTPSWPTVAQGVSALLVSPGRGLLVYSPVLLFAIVGAVGGWRTALYRWSAVAAVAYLLVAGNDSVWWGGESFGQRRLADMLPLLAVLLVPAVDAIVHTKWLRLYLVLLACSVFVELLGASAFPASIWFDGNPDFTRFSTWWHVTDNEIAAMLQTVNLGVRMTTMAAILAGSLLLGYLTSSLRTTFRDLRRPAGRPLQE